MASFEKILTSRTFKFLVGPECPDRKPLTIHTAVVEELSPPLSVSMNGKMREATDGVAILEDIDQETFARFCEYAYMGDYTPTQTPYVLAKATASPKDTSATESPETSREDWQGHQWDDERGAFSSHHKKKKTARLADWNGCGQSGRQTHFLPSWNEFKYRKYSVVNPHFRPRDLPESGQDYASTLLAHARAYIFADKYDVAGLRVLSLDKLHQLLYSCEVIDPYVEELVQLIRCSYNNENTRDTEADQPLDDLRDMVVHFAVYVFETIVRNKTFLELMEDGGCFARDLTRLLGQRMQAIGK